MTAADMDVGPARPVVLERPQRAPASRLARLLLHSGHERAVFLLPLLLMSLPACVIPVGPDFHEPLGVPNSAPYIISAIPDRGGTFQSPTFEIQFSDPNAEDELLVRWIIDYPPLTPGTTVVLPTDLVSPVEGHSKKKFECVGLRSLPTHQIMVVVADREFDAAGGDPTVAIDPGRTAVATWTWNATNCSQQ